MGADPPASKCLREQEASPGNQALQAHPDLQVLELMANRVQQVLPAHMEKRVNKEIGEIREWTDLPESQDCPESLVGTDEWASREKRVMLVPAVLL